MLLLFWVALKYNGTEYIIYLVNYEKSKEFWNVIPTIGQPVAEPKLHRLLQHLSAQSEMVETQVRVHIWSPKPQKEHLQQSKSPLAQSQMDEPTGILDLPNSTSREEKQWPKREEMHPRSQLDGALMVVLLPEQWRSMAARCERVISKLRE